MNKKIMAALVAVLLIAAGIGGYIYYKRTPAYSLTLIQDAVKDHNWDKFSRHVDVQELSESVFDDLIMVAMEEDKTMDSATKQMAAGFAQMFKPMVTKAVEETMKEYVEKGEVGKAKDEEKKARLGAVLYNLLEGIRYLAILLKPYMPETSEKILVQLNTDVRDYDSLETFGGLKAGESVGEASVLFERIDAEKLIAELLEKQKAAQAEEKSIEEIEGIAQIGIDDFAKVELRVAEIKACEPIPKAKKLLKLTLDDGTGKDRTVASGIAKWYTPDDLIGKKIVVVANLKPAVLCGVESNGMILAADAGDDVKVLFLDGSIPNGSKIR